MIENLKGLRVIVVEDECILAEALAEVLEEKGASIVGVVASLSQATEVTKCNDPCDVVVLDLKLADGTAIELGTELLARGIPVVFTSASTPDCLDARCAGASFLTKPFNFYDVVLAVAESGWVRCPGRSQ